MTRRRELLEEIVRQRSLVLATLPADEEEPPSDSRWWAAGIIRAALKAWRAPADERRDFVLLLASHALGWLESFDGAPR